MGNISRYYKGFKTFHSVANVLDTNNHVLHGALIIDDDIIFGDYDIVYIDKQMSDAGQLDNIRTLIIRNRWDGFMAFCGEPSGVTVNGRTYILPADKADFSKAIGDLGNNFGGTVVNEVNGETGNVDIFATPINAAKSVVSYENHAYDTNILAKLDTRTGKWSQVASVMSGPVMNEQYEFTIWHDPVDISNNELNFIVGSSRKVTAPGFTGDFKLGHTGLVANRTTTTTIPIVTYVEIGIDDDLDGSYCLNLEDLRTNGTDKSKTGFSVQKPDPTYRVHMFGEYQGQAKDLFENLFQFVSDSDTRSGELQYWEQWTDRVNNDVLESVQSLFRTESFFFRHYKQWMNSSNVLIKDYAQLEIGSPKTALPDIANEIVLTVVSGEDLNTDYMSHTIYVGGSNGNNLIRFAKELYRDPDRAISGIEIMNIQNNNYLTCYRDLNNVITIDAELNIDPFAHATPLAAQGTKILRAANLDPDFFAITAAGANVGKIKVTPQAMAVSWDQWPGDNTQFDYLDVNNTGNYKWFVNTSWVISFLETVININSSDITLDGANGGLSIKATKSDEVIHTGEGLWSYSPRYFTNVGTIVPNHTYSTHVVDALPEGFTTMIFGYLNTPRVASGVRDGDLQQYDFIHAGTIQDSQHQPNIVDNIRINKNWFMNIFNAHTGAEHLNEFQAHSENTARTYRINTKWLCNQFQVSASDQPYDPNIWAIQSPTYPFYYDRSHDCISISDQYIRRIATGSGSTYNFDATDFIVDQGTGGAQGNVSLRVKMNLDALAAELSPSGTEYVLFEVHQVPLLGGGGNVRTAIPKLSTILKSTGAGIQDTLIPSGGLEWVNATPGPTVPQRYRWQLGIKEDALSWAKLSMSTFDLALEKQQFKKHSSTGSQGQVVQRICIPPGHVGITWEDQPIFPDNPNDPAQQYHQFKKVLDDHMDQTNFAIVKDSSSLHVERLTIKKVGWTVVSEVFHQAFQGEYFTVYDDMSHGSYVVPNIDKWQNKDLTFNLLKQVLMPSVPGSLWIVDEGNKTIALPTDKNIWWNNWASWAKENDASTHNHLDESLVLIEQVSPLSPVYSRLSIAKTGTFDAFKMSFAKFVDCIVAAPGEYDAQHTNNMGFKLNYNADHFKLDAGAAPTDPKKLSFRGDVWKVKEISGGAGGITVVENPPNSGKFVISDTGLGGAVEHDASLEGDGTSANPLGVSFAKYIYQPAADPIQYVRFSSFGRDFQMFGLGTDASTNSFEITADFLTPTDQNYGCVCFIANASGSAHATDYDRTRTLSNITVIATDDDVVALGDINYGAGANNDFNIVNNKIAMNPAAWKVKDLTAGSHISLGSVNGNWTISADNLLSSIATADAFAISVTPVSNNIQTLSLPWLNINSNTAAISIYALPPVNDITTLSIIESGAGAEICKFVRDGQLNYISSAASGTTVHSRSKMLSNRTPAVWASTDVPCWLDFQQSGDFSKYDGTGPNFTDGYIKINTAKWQVQSLQSWDPYLLDITNPPNSGSMTLTLGGWLSKIKDDTSRSYLTFKLPSRPTLRPVGFTEALQITDYTGTHLFDFESLDDGVYQLRVNWAQDNKRVRTLSNKTPGTMGNNDVPSLEDFVLSGDFEKYGGTGDGSDGYIKIAESKWEVKSLTAGGGITLTDNNGDWTIQSSGTSAVFGDTFQGAGTLQSPYNVKPGLGLVISTSGAGVNIKMDLSTSGLNFDSSNKLYVQLRETGGNADSGLATDGTGLYVNLGNTAGNYESGLEITDTGLKTHINVANNSGIVGLGTSVSPLKIDNVYKYASSSTLPIGYVIRQTSTGTDYGTEWMVRNNQADVANQNWVSMTVCDTGTNRGRGTVSVSAARGTLGSTNYTTERTVSNRNKNLLTNQDCLSVQDFYTENFTWNTTNGMTVKTGNGLETTTGVSVKATAPLAVGSSGVSINIDKGSGIIVDSSSRLSLSLDPNYLAFDTTSKALRSNPNVLKLAPMITNQGNPGPNEIFVTLSENSIRMYDIPYNYLLAEQSKYMRKYACNFMVFVQLQDPRGGGTFPKVWTNNFQLPETNPKNDDTFNWANGVFGMRVAEAQCVVMGSWKGTGLLDKGEWKRTWDIHGSSKGISLDVGWMDGNLTTVHTFDLTQDASFDQAIYIAGTFLMIRGRLEWYGGLMDNPLP